MFLFNENVILKLLNLRHNLHSKKIYVGEIPPHKKPRIPTGVIYFKTNLKQTFFFFLPNHLKSTLNRTFCRTENMSYQRSCVFVPFKSWCPADILAFGLVKMHSMSILILLKHSFHFCIMWFVRGDSCIATICMSVDFWFIVTQLSCYQKIKICKMKWNDS
jgi:hypothetical protein